MGDARGPTVAERADAVRTGFMGARTLSEAQVARLAALVERRLAELGDPAIRPPLPADYVAVRHFSPYNHFDFAVDIDIGTTVLTLRDGGNWPHEPVLGDAFDPDAMSRAIVEKVVSVRDDLDGAAYLEEVGRTCRAKIRRDRSALELQSVRFQPEPTRPRNPTHPRPAWVRVGLLDDLLIPYTELVRGGTPRGLCRQLKRCGQDHGRRLAVLGRLAARDAVLEIDATAEHAILAVGGSVGDVVREMIRSRREGNGYGQKVVLWGDRDGDHVGVVARDGCVGLEAGISALRWTAEREIVVSMVFPDTITDALVGRPLSALVDHPLLLGTAEIARSARSGQTSTRIALVPDARPIGRGELGGEVG